MNRGLIEANKEDYETNKRLGTSPIHESGPH